MKFYIACSSTYRALARRYAEALEAEGHECTHRWWEVIEERGSANPRDATPDEARMWSDQDLRGVKSADRLIVLAVGDSVGAWFEAGQADLLCIPWVVVRDEYSVPSIFHERANRIVTVADISETIPTEELLS